MNERFTITIHNDNGVRQFNLHRFIMRALLYSVSFIGFIGLVGVATILYLNYSVEEIDKKRLALEASYADLLAKNRKLDQTMLGTQKALETKKEELDEVSSALSDIEAMIGLTSVAEEPLINRAKQTKLTSEQMATLFQFIPSGSPIEYSGITSKFGYRMHPTLGRNELHRGTDMRASMGTPVFATADAIVEYAEMDKKSGYGKLVILQHNYGFQSYFGHLNEIVIKSGQFIKKGDLIAYTGNTGLSSGPHLHYEIRFISRLVNPFWFIKWDVKNYNEIFEKENKIPWQSLLTATAHIKVQKPTQTPPLSPQVR